ATLVFLDPPYRKGLEAAALGALAANGWIAAGATIVVEHDKGDRVAVPPGFTEFDRRVYGTTGVLFLRYEGAR
ncbi:MAG: RsmD family RNA methyltransferase, partial [Alphaproteobacteria bacterium]|nr:RsmD family RNA methyltransferase [Alphaproteobacteria bacterium]